MVSQKSVNKQLKAIGFNATVWGRAEASELPSILLPDEKIFECVNGIYEGGFALLVATNMRLLLIDKKPLKYLTVEDLRFDMINQIDYSHRIMGAAIIISTGSKNLRFRSYNQQRLRKLIGHIQHRMSEIKTEQSSSAETQQQHLEKINQQLQAYLIAQFRHQEELRKQLDESQAGQAARDKKDAEDNAYKDILDAPLKPSPELADYLYAQGLLNEYQAANPDAAELKTRVHQREMAPLPLPPQPSIVQAQTLQSVPDGQSAIRNDDIQEMVEAGRREIFGKLSGAAHPSYTNGIEVNPMRIAYSKLPLALRNRRFKQSMRVSTPRIPMPTPPKNLFPDPTA